jgi:hypothetical protein
MSRSGQESLLSLSTLPRLRGPFCHPRNLQSSMLLLLNPLSHPRHSTTSPLHTPSADLDLPLHLQPIMEPGPQPPQVQPILTQFDTVPKVSAIRREVMRVFQEEEDKAWTARVSEYTMQGNLCALLQAENESITWKSYMWDLPRVVL